MKIKNILGLLIASIGIIAYRELPQYWYMLMLIPINIGYAMFWENNK